MIHSNIVESGIKHHKPNSFEITCHLALIGIAIFPYLIFILMFVSILKAGGLDQMLYWT